MTPKHATEAPKKQHSFSQSVIHSFILLFTSQEESEAEKENQKFEDEERQN